MHGRVILDRMAELIGEYEAGKMDLRRLLDDLQSIYESLEPSEQPLEREWLDQIIPLDRVLTEGSGTEQREVRRQIQAHLDHLKRIIARYVSAGR